MLSRAEMAAIGAASGNALKQLWLAGMIAHRQNGVIMAMAQQAAQYANGNQHWARLAQ